MRAPALTAILLAACTQVDVVAVRPDGAAPADAEAGFCEGSGPLVLVGDGRAGCSGAVAQTTFRYAICTCEGWATSAPIATDAFDSGAGPYTGAGGGGSVGTNGRFDASAAVSIGGGLDVGGAGVVFGATELRARGRLRSAGPVIGDGVLAVGGDARVNGDLRVESLFVGGTVVTPSGSTVEVRGVDEAPNRETGPVEVAPPCDCDDASLLDIAALVAAHRDTNDDARAGLTASELANATPGAHLELACGRYYFDRIGGAGALTLTASGRVAIFVDGDLAVGELVVALEGDAEVDLFVAGNVVGQARWTLGGPETPSRVRVYIGGAGTVELGGGAVFAGNVYAPRAELVTPAAVEVFGSLFARRVVASGPLTVHYDRAVLTSARGCPEPGVCRSCLDCGNQACIDGACGSCRSDDECCAPLVCATGTCVPQVL